MQILGVRIDNLNRQEIFEKIKSFLYSNRSNLIVTLNPEIILAARRDEEYQNILNLSALNTIDGFGLKMAVWYKYLKFPKRLTGIDLSWQLAELAEKENASIYLLGAPGDTAAKAALKLKEKFPNLRIVGSEEGMNREEWRLDNKKLVERINLAKPDILLVAFGAPKQEKWLAHNLPYLKSVKIAVGVGGTFDLISGKIKRAPLWLQKLGIEFIWRLIKEPKRWKRIYHAFIKFPLIIVFRK